MGLFDKVGDFVGDIVDGVVDGVVDVFDAVGIDLAKVLDNDWVKGGLMAVSIFTGGVAIANGVMTGFAQASAAQAANTAVQSTASSFLDTFIAGGKGFIEGVASGLANPLDTAGKLAGDAASALGLGAQGAEAAAGGLTGVQNTGEMVAADLTAEGGAQAMNQAGGAADLGAQAVEQGAGSLEPLSAQTVVPPTSPNAGAMGGGMDPASWGGADGSMLTQDGFSMGYDPSNAMSAMGESGATDAMGGMLQQQGEKGWLESLASGAKDFASSPTGMMTAANAVQGWAQGSMIEKRWDEMAKEEKKRRQSWQDFDKQPIHKYDIPSLQSLRQRTAAMQQRGNQAQSKYGYGK